jgi:exodeoxyribonuclease VII small subunit
MSDINEKITKKIEELTFEEAIKELETIVRTLESGNQDLEKSIELYERGNILRAHSEKKLAEAKLKVEKITKSAEGVKLEEFQ